MTMKDFYRYQTGEKIRFSTEVPEVGSIYRSNGPLPYIPSYLKIGLTGVLVLPAVIVKQTKTEPGYEQTPERAYNYEICHNRITIDGYYVCDAPDNHSDGKKYTVAQKLKFCKAVIWQLMYDEGSLRDQIALLGTGPINRVIRSVPDKVPEVIAVSAPIAPVLEDLVLPEVLNAYTHEGITGCPSAEEFEDLVLCHSTNYEIELEDLERDLFEGYYESCTNSDNGSEYDSLSLENENNCGEEIILYDLIHPVISPVIIRQWNHGRMIITEEDLKRAQAYAQECEINREKLGHPYVYYGDGNRSNAGGPLPGDPCRVAVHIY